MLTRAQITTLRKTKTGTGNKLRVAMTLGGVTQMQVAEAVGIAQSQVSEDAAGKFAEMSLEKARSYADFFGCTIEDLFPAREAVAS